MNKNLLRSLFIEHIRIYPRSSWRPTSGVLHSPPSLLYLRVGLQSLCKPARLTINPTRLFLVLGLIGNLATCLVITRNEYMRTTTNIYLFNLAVADLATLLFAMPVELYLMWKQYPWTLGEVLDSVTSNIPSFLSMRVILLSDSHSQK